MQVVRGDARGGTTYCLQRLRRLVDVSEVALLQLEGDAYMDEECGITRFRGKGPVQASKCNLHRNCVGPSRPVLRPAPQCNGLSGHPAPPSSPSLGSCTSTAEVLCSTLLMKPSCPIRS